MRRKSRIIQVREVKIGGGFPPVVQGMVKTDPLKMEDTVREIKKVQEEGAKLVRVAIPNIKAASP